MKTIYPRFRLYFNKLFIGILTVFLWSREAAIAQTFTTKVDKDTITLGEPVGLEVRLSNISSHDLLSLNWVNYDEFKDRFAIIQLNGPDTTLSSDGTYDLKQSIKFTSFDAGTHALQEFEVSWEDESVHSLSASALSIIVVPADISSLRDYHDVTGIMMREKNTDYRLYGLLIVSAAIILFLFLRLLKKRKPDRSYQIAIGLLDSLDSSAVTECHQLYTIIRDFYGHKFRDHRVLSYSTRDWSSSIRQKMPEESNGIIHFLHTLDRIRFGKNINLTDRNLKLEAKEILSKIQSVKIEI